jgi:DNA-directed RNA polymerase
MNKDALERQLELEEYSVELGIARYRKERLEYHLKSPSEQKEADSQPGNILIKTYLLPLSETIQAWKDDITVGKARKQALMIKFLNQLDSDTIAFITLRGVINCLHKSVTLQEACGHILTHLVEEINFRKLRDAAPGYAVVLENKFKKSTSATHRKNVTRVAMENAEVKTLSIDLSERQRLTNLLIGFVIESTGLVVLETRKRGKNDSAVIVSPTPRVLEWLESAHSKCELRSPFLLPMLVKPRPWVSPKDGGYLTGKIKLSLIKSHDEDYIGELDNWDMPEVYKAVNAIQETPWRINKNVLNTMQSVWEGNLTLGKLPMRDCLELPTKPFDIDTNEEAKKEWKQRAAVVHEQNNKLVSKRIALSQKLWVANKFKDEEVIYYPHVLDWRGRVYPAAGVGTVCPQGDDTGKALLEFAEGKTLGEDGAYWLACHIAGLFGVDKVPFDDRVQWVEDHSTILSMCALDPLEYTFWTKADKPYQALAAIYEWEGYQTQGINFVSHLPIAMDGSNNGAQHLSAMGRDSRATVNLVPCEKPQDIYMDVANEVAKIVDEKAAEGDAMAELWAGKITRSIAKRPVMTLCYGATVNGMSNQIIEEVKKAKADGKPILLTDEIVPACNWLAGVMYPAIGTITTAAVTIMDWLKNTAKVAASNDLPVHWETPVGFPVLQHYRTLNLKVVDAVIAGCRIQVSIGEETRELNRRRQAAGISPNFVHSLDSAHLMKTVNAMVDRGVTSFAMIHDSYGTHATDTDLLNVVLREEFIKLYSDDVLEEFRQQIIKQLPDELAEQIKEIPPKGALDISVIKDSQYFFA